MNKPDKGMKGGSCNRTACQQPGAEYQHKDIKAYYCRKCAADINEFAKRVDGVDLFPGLQQPEGGEHE